MKRARAAALRGTPTVRAVENPAPRRVADFFVELLMREGIERVFTVPGGTASPLMEAVARRQSIRAVVCKDELGAAFMADGHAWATGKPGVIVTIGGPGVTNTLTGLCCSAVQGNPILLVSGEVATSSAGRRAVQDGTALGLDVTAMTRPATALSVACASPNDAVFALEEALRRATHLRRPVHVSLPLDVQRADCPRPAVRPVYRALASETRTSSATGLQPALDLLRKGRRIALLVGRGAEGARRELVELAERLGAPVATTCSGKGIFPEFHPLSVGVFSFGGGPLGRATLTGQADVLVAIGTGLGEFATMNYSEAIVPSLGLIHVDTDPTVFGRNYACVPVCGDARDVVAALVRELGPRAHRATVPEWFATLGRSHARFYQPEALESTASPVRPERVMREIERVLPDDACLVADIGTSCLFVAHCIRVDKQQRCYIPMAWSCMGHPLGAALGVRLGSGRPTLCVTGDGAFLSKGLELHTAVEQGVSELVIVVLSNGGHGLVRMGTNAMLGKDHQVEVGSFRTTADIAAIARSVGAEGLTVRDPGALPRALAQAFACGRPCVVDVHVDPNAHPPLGERIQALVQGSSSAPRSA